ncbi:MAG TPA: TetR/AcrR family transcriptional regulator C-terminal domain-containing protein [Acidimicrobiales bacterium]|jgi:AcrR family transcriptional regulator|nr:TetR/AcrR family transcriptional regulator C-terminal domain-containing protein [Acidimicrobiales bacterium]
MPPRPRAGLTRDRVLGTALEIVDRDGIDALSMRRLGRELGVEAMSLYSYVESKQDLIEGVVEQVFREMPLIVEGEGQWRDRLREQAGTFRRVLLAHPNTITLVAGRPIVTDRTRAYVESALLELQRYGLDLVTADLVLGLIASFVIGHVSEQVGEESRTAAGYVTVEPEGTDAARFPNVTALVREGVTDRDREFAFGLDVLIAGIASLLPVDEHAGGD